VKLWPGGGARGIELETLNLLWWQIRLSSMSVPNFIIFPQMVLWAAIDSNGGRRRRRRSGRIINIAASSN
ncbi:MAG: hypothetical protein ACRCW3_03755, partial [Metamycoplasmataceae bacterium]